MSDSLLPSALTPVSPKLLSWCDLETRASTERITGIWGDSLGRPDRQLCGAGDCPGESNLYKQHGNAALGEVYRHDEPARASTCYQPGTAQALGHCRCCCYNFLKYNRKDFTLRATSLPAEASSSTLIIQT